jgi:hypothetical protein
MSTICPIYHQRAELLLAPVSAGQKAARRDAKRPFCAPATLGGLLLVVLAGNSPNRHSAEVLAPSGTELSAGDSDIAAEPPDQELANLARAPVRLLGLQPDNQALNLLWQLVGVAHRTA